MLGYGNSGSGIRPASATLYNARDMHGIDGVLKRFCLLGHKSSAGRRDSQRWLPGAGDMSAPIIPSKIDGQTRHKKFIAQQITGACDKLRADKPSPDLLGKKRISVAFTEEVGPGERIGDYPQNFAERIFYFG